VVDFGGTRPRRDGFLARLLHPAEQVADNFEGRIPALMSEAGFTDSKEVAHRRTIFGRIAYYSGSMTSEASVSPTD
jgi:hypothetical protein